MSNDAAEKTEEATTRRRTKERERGNVAKSKDMESALVMIGGIAILIVLAKYMFSNIMSMLRDTFENLNPATIDTSSIVGLLYPYFRYLGIIVLPFLVLLFILAVWQERFLEERFLASFLRHPDSSFSFLPVCFAVLVKGIGLLRKSGKILHCLCSCCCVPSLCS